MKIDFTNKDFFNVKVFDSMIAQKSTYQNISCFFNFKFNVCNVLFNALFSLQPGNRNIWSLRKRWVFWAFDFKKKICQELVKNLNSKSRKKNEPNFFLNCELFRHWLWRLSYLCSFELILSHINLNRLFKNWKIIPIDSVKTTPSHFLSNLVDWWFISFF